MRSKRLNIPHNDLHTRLDTTAAAVHARPTLNRVVWRPTWAIADAGSYYFFYNAAENDWLVTSDSY
jgi:hypothetical protein